MGNAAKRKGDRAERAYVAWKQANGFPYVDRSLGAGRSADRGDITGEPGVCTQIKHQERIRLQEWFDEMLEQKDRCRADTGVLVIRRSGSPDPASWYAVLEVGDLNQLMLEADGRWPLPLTEGSHE